MDLIMEIQVNLVVLAAAGSRVLAVFFLVELEILHQLLLHKEIMEVLVVRVCQYMVLAPVAVLVALVNQEHQLLVVMEDSEQHLLFLEHQ